MSQRRVLVQSIAPILLLVLSVNARSQQPTKNVEQGRSDPTFSQPTLPPGVDYTLPTETEISSTLDRILRHFERSTSYQIIDSKTGKPISDMSQPLKSASIGDGEFNDWTYSMGVVLAGMLQVSEVTKDPRYQAYTLKNFDFVFDHLDYFRRQAGQFGPQAHGYRRLLDMHELDDCGAMGAALIKAYEKKKDPRYRATIDVIADFLTHRQMRLADGAFARPRPQPVSLWVDDLYMSVPFLAQLGHLTGERRYFDDATQQVIHFSDRLFDRSTGLYDHAWFENTRHDPRFNWGRGDGWALMAIAELLSVLPEDHPDRARVLDIFGRAVQGAAAVQSGNGMWHQLLDKPDSYLETSASAMFTFAIARGVNRGWLSPVYAPVAQTGWQAVAKRVREDGQIEGICVGTTAAYDAVYYYNRPTDLNAMQGYGPVLMAGAEVITMLRSFEVERTLNTFHYRPRKR